MNKQDVLSKLQPYQDKWILITKDQDTEDIISDIVDKHKRFSPYYDTIALFIESDNVEDICNELYAFCKKNIKYVEETKEKQTTALPTGILLRGHGDCKHYAGFIAGVLDAINRAKGKKIQWCYRFASYHPCLPWEAPEPHHVFVVVKDKGDEIWIDPTPVANEKTPLYIEDIYIKSTKMALHSNIGALSVADAIVPGGGEILSTVTDFFSNLIKSFVIGDQVPNYPVKSKNTFATIVTNVQNAFPGPTSVSQANALISKALAEKEVAIAKVNRGESVDVNNTYAQMFDEVIGRLQNYITAQGGKVNPGPNPAPGTTSVMGGNNTLLLLGGAGIAAYLLFGGKKKVAGISTNNLVMYGVGGYLIYELFFKKKSDADYNYNQIPYQL